MRRSAERWSVHLQPQWARGGVNAGRRHGCSRACPQWQTGAVCNCHVPCGGGSARRPPAPGRGRRRNAPEAAGDIRGAL